MSSSGTSPDLFSRVRSWRNSRSARHHLKGSLYVRSGLWRTLWGEWKGTLLIAGCLFSMFVGRAQSNCANDLLDNIELNRQSFYRREFAPLYVENAPSGIYDGAKGYSYEDDVTGLRRNADGAWVSNDSIATLQKKVANVPITDDMLRNAEALLNRSLKSEPSMAR